MNTMNTINPTNGIYPTNGMNEMNGNEESYDPEGGFEGGFEGEYQQEYQENGLYINEYESNTNSWPIQSFNNVQQETNSFGNFENHNPLGIHPLEQEQIQIQDSQYPTTLITPPAAGECVYRETELLSSITFQFIWMIPLFSQIMNSEEKIVSPPFGSKNQMHQMVLFPRGSDGSGNFLSVFLKPVRSELENSKGEEWFRPISTFSIFILKPEPTSDEDYILYSESCHPEFVGFSQSIPGEGFPQFMNLNSISQAISSEDVLSLQCEVTCPQSDILGSLSFNFPVSNHLLQDAFTSPSFGIQELKWIVKLRENQGNLSMFLSPQDSLNCKISSFNFKLYNGMDLIISKTFTGGFTFTRDSNECGWDSLIELSCLDLSLSLEVFVELDYLVEDLFSNSLSSLPLNHSSPNSSTDTKALVESNSFLLKKVQQLEKNVFDAQNTIQLKNNSLEHMKQSIDTLKKDSLNHFTIQESRLNNLNKVFKVKNRLKDVLFKLSSSDSDLNLEEHQDSIKDSVKDSVKGDLVKHQIRISELENQVLNLSQQLITQSRLLTEARTQDPSVFSDNEDTAIEPVLTLEESMDKVQEEIHECRVALEDAKYKLNNTIEPSSIQADQVEKSGISADLFLRFAELDIARASLMTAMSVYESVYPIGLDVLLKDLNQIRRDLFSLIQSLEEFPLSPPPPPSPMKSNPITSNANANTIPARDPEWDERIYSALQRVEMKLEESNRSVFPSQVPSQAPIQPPIQPPVVITRPWTPVANQSWSKRGSLDGENVESKILVFFLFFKF